MAKSTRAELEALKNSKILTGGNRTTAANVREMFTAIIDSLINIIDDENAAGGYVPIDDVYDIADITKIKSLVPTGLMLRDDGTFGPFVERINVDVSTALLIPNIDDYDGYYLTALAANLTLGGPTGTPAESQGFILKIKDNGIARTLAFGSKWVDGGAGLPNVTVAGKLMHIAFIYDSVAAKFFSIGVQIVP
jgi:hypothetical protein